MGSTYQEGDDDNKILQKILQTLTGTGANSSGVVPSGSSSVSTGASGLVIVGGKNTTISANLIRPSDTTPYSSGDSVANSTSAPTILSWSGAALVPGGSGWVTGVKCIDSAAAATKAQLEAWVFTVTSTPTNDNIAFAPSLTTLSSLVGVFPLISTYAASTGTVYDSGYVCKPFKCAATDTKLYGLFVVRNAYTPASAENLTFIIEITQN